jgi:hypothetical protein
MINIYGYRKALKQLEESPRGLGVAYLKREGDWVDPEYVVQKYILYRSMLSKLKNRRLP